MTNWLKGVVLALVFIGVGAFTASLWLEIRRETPAAAEPAPGIWEGRRIRVEVLNGGGVQRQAAQATERLRELRFDVVHYGNLDPFGTDTSVVIARVGDIEPARRVADALGLQRVVLEPNRNLYLDVTVVLGKDWADPGAAVGVEEVGPLIIWWTRLKRVGQRLWPG